MDDFTTLPPNGTLVGTEWGEGPYETLARLQAEKHRTFHDLTHGPYPATVFGIDDSPSYEYLTDDEEIANRSHNEFTTGRNKFYAYIEGLQMTPKPRGYMMIYPSGQKGGVQEDAFLKYQILQLPRFYCSEEQSPPELGEQVWVDWRVKRGNNPAEWREPYYVGPQRKRIPKIAKVEELEDGAQDAFSATAAGQVQMDSPLTNVLLYNNPAFGYPQTPMKGLLEVSGLVHMTREIYVDKELDYSKVKKYDIIPGASFINQRTLTPEETRKSAYIQHRPQNKAYFLPENIAPKQRLKTKLFIIRETGKNYISTYNDVYSSPTMHYNIAMNSVPSGLSKGLEKKSFANKNRACTIRVNVPYGLMVNEKDEISANSVGCMVSSPFDGRFFFGSTAQWNNSQTTAQINESQGFKNFKTRLNNWISAKKLPDGSRPFILGPYGTPGLRTGPSADQNSSVLNLSNNHFWSGRLTWTSTGHYFLPTLEQVDAIYELLTSLLESTPRTNFSWGMSKPARHKSLLTWDFPSLSIASELSSLNYFINTEKYYTESSPGFSWGPIGPLLYKKHNKPINLWKDALKQKGQDAINGIVSYSRWGTDSSPFIEYYILSRKLGLGHMESWYVSLAVAAETFPKIHNGKGLGPTLIPAFGDIALNKYLEIGQRMWFKALRYLGEKEPMDAPVNPQMPPMWPFENMSWDFNVLPAYKIGPRCEPKL